MHANSRAQARTHTRTHTHTHTHTNACAHLEEVIEDDADGVGRLAPTHTHTHTHTRLRSELSAHDEAWTCPVIHPCMEHRSSTHTHTHTPAHMHTHTRTHEHQNTHEPLQRLTDCDSISQSWALRATLARLSRSSSTGGGLKMTATGARETRHCLSTPAMLKDPPNREWRELWNCLSACVDLSV